MSSSAVKPSRYDLEFADVNYIVERYQQRSFQTDPAAGTYAGFQNVLESSRQMLDMAKNSLLIFNDSEQVNPVSGEVNPLSGEVECSDEFLEKQHDDPDIKLNMNSFWEAYPNANEEISDMSSKDDIDDCFCTEIEEFGADWEFKPVFALDGLRDMIDSINNSIDDLLQQLDPYNLLNGLCPFLDDFMNQTCMVDLKALLGLIGLLLKRYSMASLDLVLNWSLLLGPIIKGAVDAMATLIEEIMQWVSHIFSCFKTYLNYARRIVTQSQQLLAETGNLLNRVGKDSLDQMGEASNWSKSLFGSGPNFSQGRGFGKETGQAGKDIFGDWSGDGKSSSWSNWGTGRDMLEGTTPRAQGGSYNFSLPSFRSQPGRIEGNKAFRKGGGVPTSYNVNYKPTMETLYGINKPTADNRNTTWTEKGSNAYQQGINAIGAINTQFLDRILAMVNSAESYLKELFGNLLISIKSLNNMINQNFKTTVKLGGMILALIDIANIIEVVAKMDGGNLCEDVEAGDFSGFENFLKALYNTDDIEFGLNEDGRATIDSGIYDLNVLKHCNPPKDGRVGTLYVSQEERNTTAATYEDWEWKW